MPDSSAQLRILLPEGVAIRLQLAGPATRMIAFLVDSAIMAAASSHRPEDDRCGAFFQ